MREIRFLRKQPRPNLWVQGVFLLLILFAVAAPAAATTPAPAEQETKAAAVAVDRQVLEEVVNKALEQHLAPVKEMLTELTIHQTSLTDILGGIGYIMGFFGLWAYFQSKKRNDS
jgi:nickel transport protein